MKLYIEQLMDCILNAFCVITFKRIMAGLVAGGFFYQLAIYMENSLCG